MHKHGTFFRVFLLVYLLVLVYHATDLQWNSWLTVFGLASGIVLALIAHLRHGYGMIVLLLIHMAIEWSEYGQQGAGYSAKEIVFYCIHTVLDFTFLWQEVRSHLEKFKYAVMIGITALLAVIFIAQYQPHPTVIETHSSNALEAIVIGGILGCTLSHIFMKKRTIKHNLQP